MEYVNHVTIELALISVCETFLLTTSYAFFSSAHGKVTRVDYILDYKTNFNKSEILETLQSIFSDDNGTKQKINHRKLSRKNSPKV
jgi:hypothetical protein